LAAAANAPVNDCGDQFLVAKWFDRTILSPLALCFAVSGLFIAVRRGFLAWRLLIACVAAGAVLGQPVAAVLPILREDSVNYDPNSESTLFDLAPHR
jgi:hypothetical protein